MKYLATKYQILDIKMEIIWS